MHFVSRTHGPSAINRQQFRGVVARSPLPAPTRVRAYRSFAFHNDQLPRPPVKETHSPGPRFAAVVLVRMVSSIATAPPSKIAPAIGLAVKPGFFIPVGHGRGGYLICTASAPTSATCPQGGCQEEKIGASWHGYSPTSAFVPRGRAARGVPSGVHLDMQLLRSQF